jgi:hypothetical protein
MPKSPSENVADFLLALVPDLLPKPIDSVAKAAVSTFKDQLEALLAEPRLKRELLDAARQAELNFRTEAPKHLKNADLVEAVASFVKPIRRGVLSASQFPPTLEDAIGTFYKPSSW